MVCFFERLYRDKVTPVQRDFAQQIHHAAGSAAFIAQSMMNGPALPDRPRKGIRGR